MKKTFTSLIASSLLAVTNSISLADTVAVYDLEGVISESGQQEPNLMDLGGLNNPSRSLTHFDIVESLNAAISDAEVKAIVLEVDLAYMNLAQVQEIRRLLKSARAAKKDVWLYTEMLTIKTALLGSVANHMTLLPEGNVMLNGLYGENMYFKNMLDKIGVKVQVVHIGDFKSAGENFYRTGPSEPAQKQSDALMDSLFEQLIVQVAEGRGIEQEEMESIVDMGLITPEKALELKLVDHLEYRTDFIKKVRAKYGEEASYDNEYALPDLDGPEINGMMDLLKMAFKKQDKDKFKNDYIAVIALEGSITDASVTPVRAQILKSKRDEKCKAIVFRVDSPGGSALASDVLWEATDEFTATGRPLVVSMGGVAASGGYYVSAGADHIFAEEGTITGSIGVVGMKFVLGGALEKLGITTHASKRGKYADIFNTSNSYTADEEKLVRDSMLDVYGTFKKRITDGRGERLKGAIEKLAGGRVYSGKDALTIGLVDEIGGLNEAINKAANLAKLTEFEAFLLPEPKSPLEGLFSKPQYDKGDPEFIKMKSAKPALFKASFAQSSTLDILGADKKLQVIQFINQAEAFRDQRVLLISPQFNLRMK